MALDLTPFTVAVPEADLDDLHDRLARTRFPAQIPGADWDYGTELGYERELVEYWRDTYDWRAAEARLNTFDHFTTTVMDQHVHLIHQRSPEPDALPLLITHGWPGSVVEFLDVIGPLTDPRAHGGDPADAFHVIAPSIPGYAFSGPTTERGWSPRRVAEAWAALMAGLGYDRYGAQGGDWGAIITTHLGLVDPAHLVGIHLNMVIAAGPPEGDTGELTATELEGLADMGKYFETDSGYMQIQATKPQTVGYALEDSPAGLAAWIVEKFRSWSDCGGDVESAFTRDQLLTNVMLYWLTGTAHSSARLYYENRVAEGWTTREKVQVPTGGAIYPREIIRPPRRWAEANYNITHWQEQPRGGHFAAMEQPELFVDDVRAFFRTVR
ncbi:MAG: epoxide hydrolase [Actinobacteria bacterium]|nr:epoxide hydrolase [Actinomycetota bacterium]